MATITLRGLGRVNTTHGYLRIGDYTEDASDFDFVENEIARIRSEIPGTEDAEMPSAVELAALQEVASLLPPGDQLSRLAARYSRVPEWIRPETSET